MTIGPLRAMIAALVFWAGPAPAQQDLSALARLDPTRSSLADRSDGTDLTLTISQPVPWRVHTLDTPPRLVFDFRQVDFARLGPGGLGESEVVSGLRHGVFRPGWTRLVLDLTGPFGVETAGMRTGADDGSARIDVALRRADPESFAARAGAPDSQAFPKPALPPRLAGPAADGRFTVVLDPGHGGIDPGAVRGTVHEADLMLSFARDLRETLVRSGDYNVILTREGDEFVSLESRLALAKQARADVFISLHADAIAEGIARGAQVYTLSEEASSTASRQLAERHDRDDLLAGIDLSGQDDRIARVLMSMARTETSPRTNALAEALVDSLRDAGIRLHRRAWEKARFSVLKAPDIPSVLLEVGFMSSPGELEKLQSAEWRKRAATAIAGALSQWRADEAARSGLIRH